MSASRKQRSARSNELRCSDRQALRRCVTHDRPHDKPTSAAFLLSTAGTRLHYSNIFAVFNQLTEQVG